MTETDDATLRRIYERTRRIAMIGASPDESRASHGVMRYLLEQGFEVVPVNPTLPVGETILGEPVCAALADVTPPIDVVDVFRRSDAVAGIVDELLALHEQPATLWLQLGVVDEAAADRARRAGIEVVMDRCMKIEHRRLYP